MRRPAFLVCALGLGLVGAAPACTPKATNGEAPSSSATAATVAPAPSAPPAPPAGEHVANNVHGFTLETIDGTERSLGDFKGKVLLLVNTASECGYTPQYAGLQKLHATYEKRGFSVVAFPSNDF